MPLPIAQAIDRNILRLLERKFSSLSYARGIKKKIENLELELDSIKDIVRDLFLMGSFTGQRISNWKKLVKGNTKVLKITEVLH